MNAVANQWSPLPCAARLKTKHAQQIRRRGPAVREGAMFKLNEKLEADTWYLGDFPLCALLLARDANYPWLILVPRIADIEEIYQLDREQRSQLLEESCILARGLQNEFGADKLNIAALGNVVPQLHLHHIVRLHSDAAWPGPVWGAVPPTDYSAQALDEIKKRLRSVLQGQNYRWR
jgi:diadenosine tetraphosphate (Ap4A) HIT family hydrolase